MLTQISIEGLGAARVLDAAHKWCRRVSCSEIAWWASSPAGGLSWSVCPASSEKINT